MRTNVCAPELHALVPAYSYKTGSANEHGTVAAIAVGLREAAGVSGPAAADSRNPGPGDAARAYQLEYQINGLHKVDEQLQTVSNHMVEIALPLSYPRLPPQCRMQ